MVSPHALACLKRHGHAKPQQIVCCLTVFRIETYAARPCSVAIECARLTPTPPPLSNLQVDKSKFATNAFDKEFLLGKTFGGGGGRYNPNEDRRQGES